MGKYQARIAADVILHGSTVDRVGRPPRGAVGGLHRSAAGDGRAHRGARRGSRASTCGSSSYGTGDVARRVRARQGHHRHQPARGRRRRATCIVGATFTGPGVGELLHAATIAVVGEVPLDTLWHAVPSFPTISEVWLRLLEAYGL